jgi:hypothetical protein
MSRADEREALAEFLRLNPEAGVSETLGAIQADPDVWADAVETALAKKNPHTALTPPTDVDTHPVEDGDDPEENSPPERDSSGSTPTSNGTPAGESGTTDPDRDHPDPDADTNSTDGDTSTDDRDREHDHDTGIDDGASDTTPDTDDDSPSDDTSRTTPDPDTESHEETTARPASLDTYTHASFASDDLARDEWPAAHRDVDAWMCRKDGKAPWAPWADDDAPVECTHSDHNEPTPCDRCRHSAKYRWGSDGSPEHVHAAYPTAREWRDKHPEARGDLAFIQREADPFVFVDGDDVRDPETGDVHPTFLDVLERLG